MAIRKSQNSDANQHLQILGSRVRALRLEKKLRILDLAKMTGLTSSMISQVESGGISPSLDTLKKISNSLDVSAGYFFEDADTPIPRDSNSKPQRSKFNLVSSEDYKNLNIVEKSPVVHEHQRKILSPGKGVNFYLLNPNMDGPIEFIYNVYQPGSGTGKGLYSHPGSECGLILEGELLVTILDKEYLLQKGDSITFDSSTPHSKKNRGKVPCVCVWANTPPYF